MNQSKPIVGCEKCFEKIGRCSTASAKIWLMIIEKAHVSDVFCYTENDLYDAQFRLLENMGFLISTDVRDHVEFKLLGRQYESDGDYYFVCGGKCRAC